MAGPDPAGGRLAGGGTGTPQIVGAPWDRDAGAGAAWAACVAEAPSEGAPWVAEAPGAGAPWAAEAPGGGAWAQAVDADPPSRAIRARRRAVNLDMA